MMPPASTRAHDSIRPKPSRPTSTAFPASAKPTAGPGPATWIATPIFYPHNPETFTQLGQALHCYGVKLLYAPTPQAKGKIERRHDDWQKRLVPLLAAEHIVELTGANQRLDQLVPHANRHEIHRELGQTPHAARRQALAQKHSVIRPVPKCPWRPYVWSQRTRVRVGDDGKVPVGAQRQSINASPRAHVIRCLRPDGDLFYLRHAPDPKAKPVVLLHVPVF